MTVRYFWIILGLVFVGSLLTGVTQVRRGERAVVRRFGRVLDEKPRPGLWIGLPWGMDEVERVPVDLVRRVTVGYEPSEESTQAAAPAGQFLTGDRNLVNLQVVIDYGVVESEVDRYVIYQDRVDALVARTAESVLAEWVAGQSIDVVLINGKSVLPALLLAEVQQRLEPYGLGVQVKNASVSLLLPPDQVRADFEKVNRAQTAIRTEQYRAEQKRSELLARAESEANRILKEAEAFAVVQRRQAQTDAINFEKRLREYRRFKDTNPDYLHDIWFHEIKKVYARMLAAGGRIEPLDQLLGRDGMDIFQVPIQNRSK
jgi:membrane protease subunit HflK